MPWKGRPFSEIAWAVSFFQAGENLLGTFCRVPAVPFCMSPELVPAETGDAELLQDTEAVIGPYELQDFHLYHTVRFGYPRRKLRSLRIVPGMIGPLVDGPDVPPEKRNAYSIGEIKAHLRTFL
jgi:NAD+ synthase (glutamine-hydrolysing)